VDLFGHGNSPKPEDPGLYSITTAFASLENWIESLDARLPLTLVGHSLGGYLCLMYALRHPEKIACLVLIDPLYRPAQISPLLRLLNRQSRDGVKALQAIPLKVIDTLLGWDPISASQFSAQARRQIAFDYKRASPHMLGFIRTISDLTVQLASLPMPTLVIWGNHDLTLNPASFRELVDLIPGAKGRMILQCGHQPHIGKPDLVNPMICDYLSSQRRTDLSNPRQPAGSVSFSG